jgi:galactose mutarotase-like enzyme
MVRLKNEAIEAVIHPMGAELQSLRNVETGMEYMWSGDPVFWGKHSPVLFPIVGTLRDNHFRYRGTTYRLPRHGFARERVFAIDRVDDTEAVFTLEDDEATRLVFPFRFLLQMVYRLQGNRLTVSYVVLNTGDDDLWFSLGAHPAFAVPFDRTFRYEDYRLRFSEPETLGRWKLQDGLLTGVEEPFLQSSDVVDLSRGLFEKDAIVMKGARSEYVTLESPKSPNGLRFNIEGWPHLGIWAAPGADFVCIEPWQGHADAVGFDGDFTTKPGVVRCRPGEDWEKSWSVEVF